MYNIIQNITGNYYYSLILLSFIFYIISKYNTSILLSIIIIFSIYIYIDINIKQNISNKNSEDIIKEESLVNEIKDIKEVDTDNFYINKSNKKVKFLIKNKEFVNIIYNVRFIKKYDNSRYTKMIIFMNKLMKIYIYILSDRYDLNTYLPIFTDTKDNIIEIFYSLVFVVPEKFKHTYGFDPQIEIDKSLGDFRIKIKYMLNVLINYGNVNKNNVYINIDRYKPFEKNKENYLP